MTASSTLSSTILPTQHKVTEPTQTLALLSPVLEGATPESFYDKIWKAYAQKPELSAEVREIAKGPIWTNEGRVQAVYQKVVARAGDIPLPSSPSCAFDPDRLVAISKATTLCKFFDAFAHSVTESLPEAQHFLATLDGDLFTREALIANWMSQNRDKLALVRTLELSGCNLNALPPQVGLLTGLAFIDLSHNQLTTIPAEIGHCARLSTFDLSNNQIMALPATIGHCTALWGLYLQGNQLTTLPSTIGYCTLLSALDLSKNQITSIPTEIGNCAALDYLNLSHNQLASIPATLGQCRELQRFYASYNQLATIPSTLGQCLALNKIDLKQNQLTTLPTELGNLINLDYLDLSHNQLNAPPSTIGNCAKLDYLDLTYNQLVTLPHTLGRCVNLDQLKLSHNPLKATREEVLCYFPVDRMQMIDISYTTVKLPAILSTSLPAPVKKDRIESKTP